MARQPGKAPRSTVVIMPANAAEREGLFWFSSVSPSDGKPSSKPFNNASAISASF
jgi:hypothetical protein